MRVLHAKRVVTIALLLDVAALLAVGVVSQTVLRHTIQVAPGLGLLAFCLSRRGWVACGAMAFFSFWLFIMILIWLYLLGIANVVTGRFTRIEIGLTLVIGAASLAGLITACRVRPMPSWPARLVAFLVAAAVQIGAMWLSLQPSFATR
jgi:hypothetical protein